MILADDNFFTNCSFTLFILIFVKFEKVFHETLSKNLQSSTTFLSSFFEFLSCKELNKNLHKL